MVTNPTFWSGCVIPNGNGVNLGPIYGHTPLAVDEIFPHIKKLELEGGPKNRLNISPFTYLPTTLSNL